MANLGGTYDASNGETMGGDVLPAGEYVAALIKSDRTEAKSGNGNAYINLEFAVQDGPMENRRFWSMLNLWNSNSQAVEIAQRELNSIMHACGKLRVDDTEELHGIPMRVKLAIKTDSYGEKNVVKSYKPLNSAGSAQSSQAQGGSTGNAPWKQPA